MVAATETDLCRGKSQPWSLVTLGCPDPTIEPWVFVDLFVHFLLSRLEIRKDSGRTASLRVAEKVRR